MSLTIILITSLASFLLTVILGFPYLKFLKKNYYKQYIREEGPASHAKKSGTPTTGGLIIVIPAIIVSLIALNYSSQLSTQSIVVITVFLLFTALGFNDDYQKITKKQNKGLSARGKLIVQSLIALIPAFYVTVSGETTLSIFNLFTVNLGYFYPLLAVFIIIGTSNAVNLTDGLDGLAAGTVFFALVASSIFLIKGGFLPLAIVCVSVASSCIGFLFYNFNPAKMFMGDTGSIALGGLLGTLAVIGKFELWLAIIGGVFVIETLSVIIQVISFKATGKRIFKMSPIHHHFELCGWSEKKVVFSFWLVAALLCAISLYQFF